MISKLQYKIILTLVFILCSQLSPGDAIVQLLGLKQEETTYGILDKKLEKYDNRIRPFYEGKSTEIAVSLHLSSVVDVDETKGDITTIIQLKQTWNDPRLVFKGDLATDFALKIDSATLKKLWLPDTFFGNEKRSFLHQMTVANDYGIIFGNGTISRLMRISLTTYCPFSYERFPFDSQTCGIVIGSHASIIQDVNYKWHDQNSVKMSPNPHGGNFFVTSIANTSYTLMFLHGEVSRLNVYIYLQRSWKPFVTRFFFPMVMFTLVSLISLWVADFQVGLLVNFFNMAFMNIFMAIQSTSENIPHSISRTNLDKYFIICLVYVIIITFVTSLRHSQEKKHKASIQPSEGMATRFGGQSTEDADSNGGVIYRMTTYQIKWYGRRRWITKKFKQITILFCNNAKWLLPIAFILTDFLFFFINAVRFRVEHSEDKVDVTIIE